MTEDPSPQLPSGKGFKLISKQGMKYHYQKRILFECYTWTMLQENEKKHFIVNLKYTRRSIAFLYKKSLPVPR